jgi:hypothetical protein
MNDLFASSGILHLMPLHLIRPPMFGIRLALLRVLPVMLFSVMAGALVPHGYMPSVGADGVRMVLCAGVVDAASLATMSDDPAAAALLDALKQAQDQHGSDGDDAPMACPFAGAAIADLPALASVSEPIGIFAPAQRQSPGAIVLARHHAATPPATGPPHLI